MHARPWVIASVIAAVAVLPSAAQADPGNAYDLTSIAVPNASVSSAGCRDLPVTVTHDAPDTVALDAELQLWRGATRLEDLSTTQVETGGRFIETLEWCPALGLGTFRLGPTSVDWDDIGTLDDTDPGDEPLDDASTAAFGDSGSFDDATTAIFTIKQATSVKATSVSKTKKGKLTIKTRATAYSLTSEAWKPTARRWVQLQRRDGSRWVTVTSVRTDKKGLATITVKNKARRSYRLVGSGDGTTWPATSTIFVR